VDMLPFSLAGGARLWRGAASFDPLPLAPVAEGRPGLADAARLVVLPDKLDVLP